MQCGTSNIDAHLHAQSVFPIAFMCACVSYHSAVIANAIDVWSLFGNLTTTTTAAETSTHAGRPATRSRFSCPQLPPSDYISNDHNGFHLLSITRCSPFQSSPCPRAEPLIVIHRAIPYNTWYYNNIIHCRISYFYFLTLAVYRSIINNNIL